MNRIRYSIFKFFVRAFIVILLGETLLASEGDGLIADIEKLATVEDKYSRGFDESLVDRIELNHSVVTDSLLPKLADSNASEKQLATYTWALGIAKDPKSVDSIISLSKRTNSERVKNNCYYALASIRDQRSGEFLYTTLDVTNDEQQRYTLLDLLARMQYEAVLPKTEEILKLDPKNYYWKSIFIFGKMGDKAAHFLIKKIEDPDPNVRTNAINILGRWLLIKEAAQPLREYFWKESNIDIRLLILGSLPMMITDLQTIKDFCSEVVAKEKESSLVKLAQETIGHVEIMKKNVETFKMQKNVSPEEFIKQYDQLYKSAGKNGDYKLLSAASSSDDEPKLKILREQILRRNSDEAFYDYHKVNTIIMLNRLIKGT
jgi:hypothetical protein